MLYYKTPGWHNERYIYRDGIAEQSQKNRDDEKVSFRASNDTRQIYHFSDAVFPSRLSVNYRYSKAVSELASDYSGCSSLIVSATLPADREECIRELGASCGYSFERNEVH